LVVTRLTVALTDRRSAGHEVLRACCAERRAALADDGSRLVHLPRLDPRRRRPVRGIRRYLSHYATPDGRGELPAGRAPQNALPPIETVPDNPEYLRRVPDEPDVSGVLSRARLACGGPAEAGCA